MNLIHSTILGILEGITEFLPVSSTGHLILAARLLHIPDSETLKSFEIIIQLGAILAVVALYLRDFFNFEILKKLAIAFIPTGIIGLLMYKIIKTYFLGNTFIVIVALLLGGIAMIILEKRYIRKNRYEQAELDEKISENYNDPFKIKDITYKKALLLGVWQSLAIIPGVSRSGATIIGGILMNLKRKTIVKFSFLLAVPTMLAATGLDILKNYKSFSGSDVVFISVGFLTSFLFSLIFIKWLIAYIQKNNFIIFGWYRILMALVFFVVFFLI